MFTRGDFTFSQPTGVKYLGHDFKFERPSRLTKFDVACVLDVLTGHRLHWCIIYDVFTYRELVDCLNVEFEKQTAK